MLNIINSGDNNSVTNSSNINTARNNNSTYIIVDQNGDNETLFAEILINRNPNNSINMEIVNVTDNNVGDENNNRNYRHLNADGLSELIRSLISENNIINNVIDESFLQNNNVGGDNSINNDDIRNRGGSIFDDNISFDNNSSSDELNLMDSTNSNNVRINLYGRTNGLYDLNFILDSNEIMGNLNTHNVNNTIDILIKIIKILSVAMGSAHPFIELNSFYYFNAVNFYGTDNDDDSEKNEEIGNEENDKKYIDKKYIDNNEEIEKKHHCDQNKIYDDVDRLSSVSTNSYDILMNHLEESCMYTSYSDETYEKNGNVYNMREGFNVENLSYDKDILNEKKDIVEIENEKEKYIKINDHTVSRNYGCVSLLKDEPKFSSTDGNNNNIINRCNNNNYYYDNMKHVDEKGGEGEGEDSEECQIKESYKKMSECNNKENIIFDSINVLRKNNIKRLKNYMCKNKNCYIYYDDNNNKKKKNKKNVENQEKEFYVLNKIFVHNFINCINNINVNEDKCFQKVRSTILNRLKEMYSGNYDCKNNNSNNEFIELAKKKQEDLLKSMKEQQSKFSHFLEEEYSSEENDSLPNGGTEDFEDVDFVDDASSYLDSNSNNNSDGHEDDNKNRCTDVKTNKQEEEFSISNVNEKKKKKYMKGITICEYEKIKEKNCICVLCKEGMSKNNLLAYICFSSHTNLLKKIIKKNKFSFPCKHPSIYTCGHFIHTKCLHNTRILKYRKLFSVKNEPTLYEFTCPLCRSIANSFVVYIPK
ncbi:hypothetical protein PFMALIP_05997, partial [Plasmodium falciparum MaliPS096_E11]